MANKLTNLIGNVVHELPYLAMVGGLALAFIGSRNDYYTGRKPFQRELKSYQTYGKNCTGSSSSDQTYVTKTLEGTGRYIVGVPIPFSARDVRVHEMELTCDRFYVNALASTAPGIVAEREQFLDGRVNVLIDLKNKYQSQEVSR